MRGHPSPAGSTFIMLITIFPSLSPSVYHKILFTHTRVCYGVWEGFRLGGVSSQYFSRKQRSPFGQKSRSAGDLNASRAPQPGVYFIYLGDYTHTHTPRGEQRALSAAASFFSHNFSHTHTRACKYIRNEKNAVCWSPYGAVMNVICLRGQSHHT